MVLTFCSFSLLTVQNQAFVFICFSGTGYEVWGNCNAPKAITLSALIYCLRCMVGHDVPLNQVKTKVSCFINVSIFLMNVSVRAHTELIIVRYTKK